MESKEIFAAVLDKMPQQPPFRFIDEITNLDDQHIDGNYFLKEDADFYKGHFPGFPITPGVVLTEIMAQIGMVAFGIYLMMMQGETAFTNMATMLTETNIKFKKQVLPGQRVFVHSEKKYFRHGKLECNILLKDRDNKLLCFGSMSGMVFKKP
jgi:3-hydroxyacyl-[acyl-carrier-protein] dehydratase